jgi:hypothetical protein
MASRRILISIFTLAVIGTHLWRGRSRQATHLDSDGPPNTLGRSNCETGGRFPQLVFLTPVSTTAFVSRRMCEVRRRIVPNLRREEGCPRGQLHALQHRRGAVQPQGQSEPNAIPHEQRAVLGVFDQQVHVRWDPAEDARPGEGRAALTCRATRRPAPVRHAAPPVKAEPGRGLDSLRLAPACMEDRTPAWRVQAQRKPLLLGLSGLLLLR